MELEAGCVVGSIHRLRRYLFSVFFLIFTDHECLQQISKIGESKTRIQRWMEFLSANNCRLSYRRERDNANADFLARLPIPPTAGDISGSSALTDPNDLGVYLIRACGYTTASCPIPGVGLGGLTTSFYGPTTDQNSSPTTLLGGLPLTKDDFRTHRALMPLNRMADPTASRSAIATNIPWLSYAINDHNETPRSNCARHTRNRTATLTGNTPLWPDHRMADRSGFAASAAPSPPPKSTLRSSPLPRSARLGFIIPLRRPASHGDGSQPTNGPPTARSTFSSARRYSGWRNRHHNRATALQPCWGTAPAIGTGHNARNPCATPLVATYNLVAPTPFLGPFATTHLHT